MHSEQAVSVGIGIICKEDVDLSSSDTSVDEKPVLIEGFHVSGKSSQTSITHRGSNEEAHELSVLESDDSDFLSVTSFHSPKFKPPVATREREPERVFTHKFQSTPTLQYNKKDPRFRRRGSAQTLTKLQKEKLFEEDADDNIDESDNIFNVPIANSGSMRIFQSKNQSKEVLRKAWNQPNSNLIIPPSPLPGRLNENEYFNFSMSPNLSPSISKNKSFSALSPAARQLSSFYEYSSHSDAQEEIKRRSEVNLPINGSESQSVDDLTLASQEKVRQLTITRPTWCPPKSEKEALKHERQFKEILKLQGRLALKEAKKREERLAERLIGDERLGYLISKDQLTSKNMKEIRKYIKITKITTATKLKLFDLCIGYWMEGHETKKQEIQNQNQNQLNNIPTEFKDKLIIASTSSSYNNDQILKLAYFMDTILDKQCEEKIVGYLSRDIFLRNLHDFKDDISILNFKTLLNTIAHLPADIFVKTIEIFIVYCTSGNSRGLKFLMATVICIIRDYHYGWSNLQMLLMHSEPVYVGSGDENQYRYLQKVEHWYNLL